MATQYDRIETREADFIAAQQIFFVATAAPEGRVNLSPKGMDSLRVAGPNRILWMNVTGSGNETAGHLRRAPRMTLMWCSFGTRPLILRAYSTARAIHRADPDWAEAASGFEDRAENRQVIDMDVDLVQTSCGYAVPRMDLVAERDTLRRWSDDKGEAGLRAYWAERNATTLDGDDTGITAALAAPAAD